MSKTIDRQDFVRSLRDFVKRECGTRERRQELSSNGHVTHNQELYRKLAGLGWVGCAIPAEYGGGGGSASDACHLVEEMSYGLAPLFGLGVSLVSATVVERFGTEEQKQDILGGVCRGEVLATAISEPGAGSDPASMMCRAERRGDSYVINGQKTWISCAHIASRIQVLCRTDTSGSKHDGITMIDVPADAEGLEVRTITRALIFRVLPVLAMTIAAGVAVLKWHQVSLRADHRASIESVQAATEATIMMLS